MRFKTKPYSHQLEAFNKAAGMKAFAWLMEMGTGKTWDAINDMARLHGEGKIDGVLVFAPKGVHENWLNIEMPTHMPDWTNWKAVCWRAGANKKHAADVDEFLSSNEDRALRVFLVNWDALINKKAYAAILKFCRTCMSLMIICDESHRVKTPSAGRTKALMKLKPYSKYRRIMTGTPVLNAPFDLFSQFAFLDESILRTSSYYAFKSEYAEMEHESHHLVQHIKRRSGRAPQLVAKNRDGTPRYKNLEKLEKLIEPYSYRVLKKDCLDLPDKVYVTRTFELTKEQKKAYDLMEKECRLVLADESVTAVNKLSSLMKLAQMSSCYYNTEFGIKRIEGKNPKLDLLKEELEDALASGSSVIVWARFRLEIEDIALLCKTKKWPHVQYHGGVSGADRSAAIDAFQSGETSIFIGQQKAGGTGITLTRATNVIYYSNTFSLEDRLQSEDRAHRIGQNKKVTYTDLIAEGTIDRAIVQALVRKQNMAALINGDLI